MDIGSGNNYIYLLVDKKIIRNIKNFNIFINILK